MPTTIALLGERPDVIEQVYSADRLDALARRATWHPVALASRDLVPGSPGLDRIDALFATWGLARLDDRQLDALPRVRAVFYAASSVTQFAEPMLRRGIRVVSAWSANAFPVAEFALAQVLLALKGYFACAAWVRAGSGGPRPLVRGTFEATIALLGYGQVARHLRRLLRSHDLSVLVVDPYLDAATAASEQVELVSMAEAFARALATPEGAGDPYLRSAAERARRSAEQVAAAAAAVPVAILAGDHRAVLDAVADYVAVAHPERLEPAWAAAVCTAWMHLAKADPKDLDRWHQAASAAGIDLGAPCPPGK